MNYKVILDEGILREFIGWLPELTETEQFYLTLFGRKKYCPEIKYIKSDKSQLARKTCTKERLFYKIKQLEVELGSYRQFQDEMPIPQEALAAYINPNPRCLYKATLHGISTLARLIELNNKNHNPHQEMLSCIQRSCSRKIFSVFDIDTKEIDIILAVTEALGGHLECAKILETRGGYHVLVKLETIPNEIKKTWYQKLAKLSDVTGDALIPIPGTYQGGFCPHFIN